MGQKTIAFAEDHSIKVTILESEKATRKNFESYMSNADLSFNLVFLNGHGDESSVLGYNNEPIVIAGKNEHTLKSTITYSISCSSAMKLGNASINAGALYKKAKDALWDSITIAESSGNRSVLSWLLWDYYAFESKGDKYSKL